MNFHAFLDNLTIYASMVLLARQQGVTHVSKVKGSGVSVQGKGNQVATGGSVNIGGNMKARSG